jgi:hypothetical protein
MKNWHPADGAGGNTPPAPSAVPGTGAGAGAAAARVLERIAPADL